MRAAPAFPDPVRQFLRHSVPLAAAPRRAAAPLFPPWCEPCAARAAEAKLERVNRALAHALKGFEELQEAVKRVNVCEFDTVRLPPQQAI